MIRAVDNNDMLTGRQSTFSAVRDGVQTNSQLVFSLLAWVALSDEGVGWGLLVALHHYSFDTRGSLGSYTGCSYCGSLFFDYCPREDNLFTSTIRARGHFSGEWFEYLRDPEHKIDLVPIRAEQDLTIECQPVRILDSS
ncbi:hypothetical protein E2562_030568 [Oryza meyeriana var. granulata]|uniref:Uncharacterized protein n=1 Tax=Oryza meyeriana var. granulata TaxID=110450 RepID=A0A6G1BP85_9ORYZ|nr:hypothetical protein E2562_030568 [Oryza meyeriana var. granulata]